jgi:hypothetical protein
LLICRQRSARRHREYAPIPGAYQFRRSPPPVIAELPGSTRRRLRLTRGQRLGIESIKERSLIHQLLRAHVLCQIWHHCFNSPGFLGFRQNRLILPDDVLGIGNRGNDILVCKDKAALLSQFKMESPLPFWLRRHHLGSSVALGAV